MDGLVAGLAHGRSQPRRDEADSGAAETTGGRPEYVKWVEVATTVGHANAVIISGRLESNDIPTRITQEAAGTSVLPVNVGILSQAQVWVPEEYEAAAREILAQEMEEEEE
jgi:hypothetical protein